MEQVTRKILEQFFQKLGERFDRPASFYLVGGSALLLLGSPRETIDVDYTIESSGKDFDNILHQLSNELRLDLEHVPLEEFIPLPDQAAQRHRFIGRYGKVDVYIFDPYSIALSKLDRGFETDIDDIVFLIRKGLVALPQLEQILQDVLPGAGKFDINPVDMQKHLQAVRDSLK